MLGYKTIAANVDSNSPGLAEAFPATAQVSGTTSSITVYVDSHSRATRLIAALYSDHNGHPGARMTSGSLSSLRAGAWNTVRVGSTAVSAGDTYWVAVLGTGGALYFRDVAGSSCSSETSRQGGLTSLPSWWISGITWATCKPSAFVNGVASTPPTMTLLPPSNLSAPSIVGSPTEGQTLTTSDGTWLDSPTSYAYQWEDCGGSGNDCTYIAGATSNSYTLRTSDVGHTIRSVVTARSSAGSASVASLQTAAVSPRAAPKAAFTYSPSAPVTGQAVHFDASSSRCAAAPCTYSWADDPPASAAYSLGAGQALTFTFQSAGTKYVTLTVTDALNRTATVEHDIAVAAAPPAAPVNTSPPSISGTAQQGQTLTGTNGSWNNSPTSYAYQWEDCDSSGSNCATIGGATSNSYTLAAGDMGHTMRFRVTASNSGGSGSASSGPTAVVIAATTGSPPTNTAAPAITGTPQQGNTLSTSNGSWSGSPTSYRYQWQDCNSSGASCSNIAGATASTYALQASDVGSTIRSVVTATNASGSASAFSAATAAVISSSSDGGGGGGGPWTVNCPLTHAAGAGPSSCWAAHTGVQGSTGVTEAQIESNPAGYGFTKHMGDMTINQPNTTVDHLWIVGCISIADGANDTTIKNTLVTPSGHSCSGDNAGGSAINTGQGPNIAKNTLIEDVTIDGGNPGYGSHTAGITLDAGEALRVNLFGFAQGFISDTNTAQYPALFQDDYGHDYNGCSHDDGTWFNSSSYVTFEHGWIMTNDPTQQGSAGCSTGALTGGSDYGPQTHVVFDSSYGEGVTGEDTHAGCGSTYSAYTNNALSNDTKDYGSGFVATDTGNTWSGNYIVENSTGANQGTISDPQGSKCPG